MNKEPKSTKKLSDEELMDLMGGYGGDIISQLANQAYQNFKRNPRCGGRPSTKYGVAPDYGVIAKYGIAPAYGVATKYGIAPDYGVLGKYGVMPATDYGIMPR